MSIPSTFREGFKILESSAGFDSPKMTLIIGGFELEYVIEFSWKMSNEKTRY